MTLANNHALDCGREALIETFDHLRAASIAWVGASSDLARARVHQVLDVGGIRIAVIGLTDHPAEYSAGEGRCGVAFARSGTSRRSPAGSRARSHRRPSRRTSCS